MRRFRKSLAPTEHESQCAVIDWWRWKHKTYSLPEFALFAIPNGGQRSKAVAGKLKAEGVRAGVLDLMLAVPVRAPAYAGLFIEMKRHPNKETVEQVNFINYLRGVGYCAAVAWDSREAIAHIEAYLRYWP